MNAFKLTLLVVELNYVYEKMREKYVKAIDHNKKPRQISGMHYGRMPLFSTVGTQFKKVVGHMHHEYAGNAYYDLAFQVGGVHSSDFLVFKEAFITEWKTELAACLRQHSFIQDNSFFVHDDIRILFAEDVGHGTNYSTYCGLCICIKDKDNYREQRLSKEWLNRAIR